MLERLPVLAVLTMTAGVPLATAASPLRFQCDTYMEIGREHTRRLTTVDLDGHTVEDGGMRFHDGEPMLVHGSPLPLANSSVSFVRRAGERVEWGSRKPVTSEIIFQFSLDLASGGYLFSVPDQTFARGRCRRLPDSI